jgi:hypothetical protein
MLRVSYWTGAVADGFFSIALVFPRLWGMALEKSAFDPNDRSRTGR